MIIRYIKGIFQNKLSSSILRKTKNQVASGPFAGMKYGDKNTKIACGWPGLLGTYELELRPIIEALCNEPLAKIVNIGASDGYYAVGLAIRNPKADVIAFEMEPEYRMLIRQNAERNGVENNINIQGFCDIPLLSSSIEKNDNCLVLMDIEGGEKILLDNSAIPQLNKCYILVELHDFVIHGLGEIIYHRFRNSHKITEIWQRPRKLEDFPIKLSRLYSLMAKKYFIKLLDERRPCKMRWFFLEPIIKGGQQ